MIQVFDVEYDFSTATTTALDVLFTAVTLGCRKLRIVPDPANGHPIVVKGLNGKPIKQIATPTSTTAVQDEFEWNVEYGGNLIQLNQLQITGTSGDKAYVSAFVG